ncbi:Transcription factor FER-LIKE IRON DEFICIENCY-INDUCED TRANSCRIPTION FACTOR [Sesamum angolense]|uniref:Transcription factor FER-LIKE IRON DEFICIENCY-INDUCED TRANSCRIPTION FACTOR n=1 Tax=Sesamum angolense TaxID=2727404 RepID=A0AAE1XAQ3_9LAMI|nr:Transcription factor FER-LIKE IRON DEFICIENCY-INDUCED TRANSCRIPTION FACTOR [Sesamum angolense]
MERLTGEETGINPFQEYATTTPDFGLIDFMDSETNLDQFIDLIREDNAADDPIANFSSQPLDRDQFSIGGGCLVNVDQLFPPAHDQLFDDLDVAINHVVNISTPPDCSALDNVEKRDDDEDHDVVDDEEESSATTANTSMEKQRKSSKADRSRTLISERRRRGRMKEKLYALRSLVPNITKMDKASIVGDAVLYVQDLQMQAKKLKSEIAGLESSILTRGNITKYQDRTTHSSKKSKPTSFYPTLLKKISKMDVFQVEEEGFYVRVVCNKGKGVAAALYKALQSLKSFRVQNSNLATCAENYVFTFTLMHITQVEVDVNLQSLKMWVASVFRNQGFDFETLPST